MNRLNMIALCCLAVGMLTTLRAGDGGVGDPQLMTDHPFWPGELSCSTFERLFKTQAELYTRVTGRKVDNDEDKALASWYWRNTHYFHCTLLPEPDIFATGKHEPTRDYWAGVFSYGHGMCQENHYQYTAEMQYLLGHCRSRAVFVSGHTSFEVALTGGVYGQGKWVLLDSDVTTVCFDKDQKKLMNIEELIKVDRKQYLTNRPAKDNRAWLPELHPGDGAGTYTEFKGVAPQSGYAAAPPIVNLRPGETLRRFPRPGLGAGEKGTLAFWGICVDGFDGPNRHKTYCTEPDKYFNATARPKLESDGDRRGRFGNALFTYVPDFGGGGYKAAVAAEDDKSVTFVHDSPFIIACVPVNKQCHDAGATLGLVLKGKAVCQVSVSTDGMKTFSAPVDFKDGLDLTDLVKGRYQYWLKFMAAPASLAGKNITIQTLCMANGYVMPHLKPDGTSVTFNAGGLATASIGPQAEAVAKHIVDGGLDKKSFTLQLQSPRGEKIKKICWAVRSPTGSPPKPEIAFKAEYSTDGKEWKVLKDDWRVVSSVPIEAPDFWSQSFFYGAEEVAVEGGKVQLRISNNYGKSYMMGQFSIVYEVANTAKTKVTFCWDEAGKEKTAEHTYPAGAKMDATWKIATGKNPLLKWVEMTPIP